MKKLPEIVPTVRMLELTSKEILVNVKSFRRKLKFKKKQVGIAKLLRLTL